ncbi:MAG: TetR/AcrR family transcriptional regulator [Evtepia sp.]|uniref:TetR/AcrR family transcriptional regulator n=1 Tax=Evtepia sp. TaxID=2773933 RepID=UPI002A748FB4|nr:TetR/AcrR family transcriptional regulator [Evtepia sp.]MDY3014056.1 TetR/AcrR family transcriptional regulator [Evtepia sp.]
MKLLAFPEEGASGFSCSMKGDPDCARMGEGLSDGTVHGAILLTERLSDDIVNYVQFGGKGMNKAVTSKEEILSVSKNMVAQQGLHAINMRSVAKQCGVAVGSVYNYFPSKNDLVIATIDAIWREIIQGIEDRTPSIGFLEEVEKLFYGIKSGGEKYPFFFGIHSMGVGQSGRDKGREIMFQCFDSIQTDLLSSLQADERVNHAFFSGACTQKAFVEFVFSNLISLLSREEATCDLLSAIIREVLYRP